MGWEEWLSFPDLGLKAILAKVDTGARTSALHTSVVEPFGPSNAPRVRFLVNPNPDKLDLEVTCTAPIVDRRNVTSSNGDTELRYVIHTNVQMGDRVWPIDMTLTNRENMSYRMLLGRTAIMDDMTVDPNHSRLQPHLSFDLYGKSLRKPPVSRPLNIALLTREPNNYSSQRIMEAAESRGHTIVPIDTNRCYMSIGTLSPEVHYDGSALPRFDAVIPRIGASTTAYGTAVLRQFANTGAYCLNSAESILNSRDKLLAHQLLSRAKVEMPLTAFANSPKDTAGLIDLVGGAPMVVKLLSSTQGRGVVLAETKKAAESLVDAFRGLEANFIVQEFVAEAAGADTRCFVIGNKVVGAMTRRAADGDFRSNLHRGGKAEAAKLTKLEREVAKRAVRQLGLSVAGVDVLRTESGPKILEVNSSPGLEGIERATGNDIALKIIEHLEQKIRVLSRNREGKRMTQAIADA